MADEFSKRRLENPDYDVTVHIQGVTMGVTGKIHWFIEADTDMRKELLAEVLDRAAIVLRGECE